MTDPTAFTSRILLTNCCRVFLAQISQEFNMKQSVFFLFALLLMILASPLTAQDNPTTAGYTFELGYDDGNPPPRRDPGADDWITYDDGEVRGVFDDARNYFSRVSFTAESDFSLRCIRFMPFNPGPNFEAPCYIYVFREDRDHNLDERYLFGTRINQLERWDERDLNANWVLVEIGDEIRFETGTQFSVIYGPAPGGEWDGNPREGDGWWNTFDGRMDEQRSFVAPRLETAHNRWTSNGLDGDLLIRVGGEFISDNNAPEWENVPARAEADEGDRVRFDVRGVDRDEDDLENLTIEYYSEDIPDAAEFLDRGEGVASFQWETAYEDAGDYRAQFTLSDGEDDVTAVVEIRIVDVNLPPELTNWPNDGEVDVYEEETLSLVLNGSDPDGDEIRLYFNAGNLPRDASFGQVGENSWMLRWHPRYGATGQYRATFILSDGAHDVEYGLVINVLEANEPPEWTEYPENREVIGYINEEIVLYCTAEDPEGADLELNWEYAAEPPADPRTDFSSADGDLRFIMMPERDQYGEYSVRFTASDGDNESSIVILIDVRSDHFHYIETGLAHTLRFQQIFCFGEDLMQEAAEGFESDEIGVLTREGVVAGGMMFGDDFDPRRGRSMIAWGDNPNTGNVEGFRHGENFTFLYWDNETDTEYDVLATITSGDRAWRWNGYSVVELFIGPKLDASADAHDFGEVQVNEQADWQVTFTSNGSTTLEGLELEVTGEGFSVDDDGPVNLDPGEEWTVTVSFTPGSDGEFEGSLRVFNEFVADTIALSGTGIQTGYFDFTVTRTNHRVEVVRAVLGGNPLENGNEIGIFTPAGLCAGAVIVADNERWSIPAWGDNPETGPIDGFRNNELLNFRLWDNNAEREYQADATFLNGPDHWHDGARSAVILTTTDRHFKWVETEAAHHLTVAADLQDGDEIAVITPRGTVAGGIVVEGHEPWEFDAYGDNPDTRDVIEGFLPGEPIFFRVWLAEREQEQIARGHWQEGPSRWTSDARSSAELRFGDENRAPTWRPLEDVTGHEGQELTFAVLASDPDHDPLSLSLIGDNLPNTVEFTDRGNGAGEFVWTPGYNQAGRYGARFDAFDGWDHTELLVTITIINANQPPILTEIGNIEIDERERFSLVLEAVDPNGDELRFTAENLPYGASLEGDLFRWTPNADQSGEYEVTFRVTDFGQPPLSDTETVTITVNDENSPPVWEEVEPIFADEGARVLFEVTARDLDDRDFRNRENNLRLSAGNLPEGARFTDRRWGRGVFDWQTDVRSAGEYHPYFVAFDGENRDTLVVDITIQNRNRPPRLAHIENQTVTVGDTLELQVTAEDADPGHQEDLLLTVFNLPPGAVFTDHGSGEGSVFWAPGYDERGVYSNVRFVVTDPIGARDEASVTFTSLVIDREPPEISDLSPENAARVRNTQPVISATIIDQRSNVEFVELVFDNHRCQVEYDAETGEMTWQPEDALDEGEHRYLVRAVDSYRNVAVQGVYFIVNGDAGRIVPYRLPEYTQRERIPIYGTAEPFLNIELWRDDERLMQTAADARGYFRFADVPLVEELNQFTLTGGDRDGNIAQSAEVETYLDIQPPEVEFVAPEPLVRTGTPVIGAIIQDAGVGLDPGGGARRGQGGIELLIDGERIEDFEFEDGRLSYTPDRDRPLRDGGHIVGITAVDRLGNVHEEPVQMRFFIDTRSPSAEHRFLDDDPPRIGNRNPQLTIPIIDPRPSSGINERDIVLLFDREEYEFEWDGVDGSIFCTLGVWNPRERELDPLDEGEHTLELQVLDRAGNSFRARGGFILDRRIRDEQPPFFENLYPPPGGVAGAGVMEGEGGGSNADTVSVVIGDDDSGVDDESIWMMIIAFNDPDDPDDDDTTYIGRDDMLMRPGGRVVVPLHNNHDDNVRRDEMPGLEEGLNQVNVFGADEEENEGDEGWEFYYDNTEPEPADLDEPDNQYVNSAEISITGTTGSDEPEYEEGYDNEPVARVFRNDSLAVEEDVEYSSNFEIQGIALVEGWNSIYVIIVDGGGNESEHSDTLEFFLDLVTPVIEDLAATNGPYLATGIPEFSATLTDVGGGVDPDSILLNIDDIDVPTEWNAESSLMTAQVLEEDALENGEYTAQLIVFDLAGNADTSLYEFDIDLDPVDPPTLLTLEPYTSINKVSLAGEGEVGTTVKVYLNDEEIGEISLSDSASYIFEYTAESLTDTSMIDLTAVNPAGTESEHTDPETLFVDTDPPAFSDAVPGNGENVEATALEEIRVLVNDLISGIEPDSFALTIGGQPFGITVTATDSGYWVVADVSEEEYGDGETVEVVAETYDRSTPPNQGQIAWEFVAQINDAPETVLPDTSFNEDEQLTLDLHDYITDEDNSWGELNLSVMIIEGADNADATIDDEEGFLYLLPDEDWSGDLQIIVQATDPDELSGTDTISVQVFPINDSPVWEDVPDDTSATVGLEFELLITATDPDPDDDLTYSDNTGLFDISENGLVSFTPDEEMLGQHVIEFYVCDDSSASDTAEFHLYIDAANQLVEVARPINNVSLDEDFEEFEFVDLDTVFNDPDEDMLNFLIEYDEEGVLLDIDAETNVAMLSAVLPDFYGEVKITVTADDLDGSQVSDTFMVNVLPVNDPPRQVGLLPDLVLTVEDEGRMVIADLDTVFIDIEDNDITFEWEDGDHLGVDIDENMVLSVTTDDDWYGEESFLLSIEDGVGQQSPRRLSADGWQISLIDHRSENTPRRDEATVIEISIEVEGVNDAPRLMVDDPYIIYMEEDQEPLTVEPSLAEMFFDPDLEDVVEVTWEEPEGPIELSFDNEEEYIIATIVEENYYGEFDYEITALDSSSEEVSVTLHFNVAAVNDPPEFMQAIDDVVFDEDVDPRRVNIADLDEVFEDVDDDDLAYSFQDAPDQLNMDIDEDNVLFVVPDDNYNLEDGVLITVIADDDNDEQFGARVSFIRQLSFTPVNRDAGSARQLRSIHQPVSGDNHRNIPTIAQSVGSQNSPRRDDAVETDFTLTINPVNDTPFWEETQDQAADEADLIEFIVTADDIDLQFEGDDLTLTITDDDGLNNRGSQFSDNGDGTGSFTWQTGYEDAGVYNPVFRVEDTAEETDQMSIRISINNVNQPPVWVDVPDEVDGDENELLQFTLTGSDPDGDDVTIEISDRDGLPEEAEFTDNGDGSGTFSWTAGYEEAGNYSAVFTLSDGEYDAEADVEITINNVNRAPVWDEPDPNEAIFGDEEDEILFDVMVHDPDDDDVTIELSDRDGLPEEAEFIDNDNGTGEFIWQTDFDSQGEYLPIFTVSDGDLSIDVQITIGIGNVNLSPMWDAPDPNEAVIENEDEEVTFEVRAHDPNDDDLTIEMTDRGGLPEAADFTDNEDGTGNFSWQTTFEDAGEYYPVFTVSDGELEIETELTIIIEDENRPPEVVNPIDDIEIDEDSGELEVADLDDVFADPDEDDLTFEIVEGVEELNLNINNETNVLTLEPTENYFGESQVVIQADDGREAMHVVMSVSSGLRGGRRADGLSSVRNLRNISGASRQQSPRRDATIADEFQVTVLPVNDPPVWDDIPDSVGVNENELLEVTVRGSDLDNDDLTISIDDCMLEGNYEFTDNGDGTAVLSWVPSYWATYDEYDEYRVEFTLTDGEAEAVTVVRIFVYNVNRLPVIVQPEEEVVEIHLDDIDFPPWWEFNFLAEDEDHGHFLHNLTWSISDRGGLRLSEYCDLTDNGDGRATLGWWVDCWYNGEYNPVFRVEDGNGGFDEVELVITVDCEEPWADYNEVVEGNENELIEFGVDVNAWGPYLLVDYHYSDDLPDSWEGPHDGSWFSWTPTFDDAGEYTVTFVFVNEEYGNREAEVDVGIIVHNVNRNPVITQPEENRFELNEGEGDYVISFLADDPDGDELEWSVVEIGGLPDGWNFHANQEEAEFSWEPDFNDAGEYDPLFRVVDDGGGSNEIRISIIVNEVNRNPIWDEVPEMIEADEDHLIEFAVCGSDPDGDDLEITFSSDNLPEAAELTDNGDGTGDFIWQTTFNDAGEYTAIFTLSDGEANVVAEVTITVNNVNRDPQVLEPDEIPLDVVIEENEELVIEFVAEDPDNDDMTWSIADEDDLPEGWEFTDNQDGTALFNWTPAFNARGEYNPLFRVEDGNGGSADVEVNIFVGFEPPPRWIEIPHSVEVDEGQLLEFDVVGGPEDRDLSITCISDDLPDGWEFTDNDDGTGTFTWEPTFDDAGEYNATFTLSDGELEDEANVSITANNVNRDPVITQPEEEVVEIEGDEGEEIIIEFVAEDPDDDDLTWSIADEGDLPEGWEFTDNGDGTAEFCWTPRFDDEGNYDPVFRVSDNENGSDEVTVVIRIQNIIPLQIVEPEDGEEFEVNEGDELVINLRAIPDDDNLTFEAENLPEGATLEGDQFSWTPTHDQAGVYEDIVFRVMDDGEPNLSDEITITITVLNVNRPPVLSEIGNLEIDEAERLSLQLEATDPDFGDNLTFEAENLPEGATLEEDLFSWTPSYDQAGVYEGIIFRVRDDGEPSLSNEDTITITVIDVDRLPIWVDYPEQVEIDENQELEFTVVGSDPDGDDLSISFASDDLPDDVEFEDHGDGTGTFTWQTTYENAGEYTASFTLSDGDEEVGIEVPITVNDVNRPPIWVNYPEQVEIDENQELGFTVVGEDPDDDDLSISFASEDLPEEAQFADNGDGTGTFNWTPSFDDAGEYTASFVLSDGEISVEAVVNITVNNVNRNPYPFDPDFIEAVILEGEEFFLELATSDPDGDDLVWSITDEGNLPDGWEFTDFGDGSFEFRLTPSFEDAGCYEATFRVDDGFGGFLTLPLILTVINVNRAPDDFSLTAPQDGYEIDPQDYTVRFEWDQAVDPDGDEVIYNLFINATYEDIDTTVSVEGLEVNEFIIEHIDSLLIELGIVSEESIEVEAAWWVEATDGDLATESSQRWTIVVPIPTSAHMQDENIPTEFSLEPVYPNPFNPSTHIDFALPEPTQVRLAVWDGSGRLLEVILSKQLPVGRHSVSWSANNLPTGIYIFTLEANGTRLITKGMLIR